MSLRTHIWGTQGLSNAMSCAENPTLLLQRLHLVAVLLHYPCPCCFTQGLRLWWEGQTRHFGNQGALGCEGGAHIHMHKIYIAKM